jgi:hypothetical protein
MEHVTWPGISGQSYTMELYPVGIPFFKKPGVYIFCKLSPLIAGKWAAIYVGECQDFDDRLNLNLQNHPRWTCIQREGATNISALFIPGERSLRLAAQADLRQRIKAPCNR